MGMELCGEGSSAKVRRVCVCSLLFLFNFFCGAFKSEVAIRQCLHGGGNSITLILVLGFKTFFKRM